jgi:hypothetical protein
VPQNKIPTKKKCAKPLDSVPLLKPLSKKECQNAISMVETAYTAIPEQALALAYSPALYKAV